MNKYLKSFFLRGLCFSGLGPVVAGIVYAILSFTIEDFSLSGTEVFVAIISTYLLAFIQAGASIFNQIENWPIAKSLGIHLLTIYIAYLLCYLTNLWIPFDIIVVLIFTLIFLITYLIVWFITYLIVNYISKKMNKCL